MTHMTAVGTEPRVAVLIAAHNEELVIGATLESVLASYGPEHAFVFDDASTDSTVAIARTYLPAENVIEYPDNVGKSKGLEYALEHYIYPAGYRYVTILDADTTLEPEYRARVLATLVDPGVACAAGQVKSRPYAGNVISVYRACLYFLWQGLFKRLLSAFNAIAIAPGCASTWRTSALRQLQFNHEMSTEDFHLSIQAHRLGVGRIRYVHDAVVWTQDPLTLVAFLCQARRWSRAWWEAVRFHRLGLKWVRRDSDGRWRISRLDIANAVLIVSLEVFFIRLLMLLFFVATPVDAQPRWLFPDTVGGQVLDLAIQGAVVTAVIMIAAMVTGRLLMVPFAPLIAGLMVAEFVISMLALAAVVRRLYRASARRGARTSGAWASPERRPIRAVSAHDDRATAGLRR